jgi:hypothetical protein
VYLRVSTDEQALSGVRGARYGKREQALLTGQQDEAN